MHLQSAGVYFGDLELPPDFPLPDYEATYNRIVDTFNQEQRGDFLHAWLAVAFRFKACAEHDEEFRNSLGRAGNSPPQPEKYIQDRELFAFFVTGFSVMDSLCYGLFNIGHMLNAAAFPMTTEKQKRGVNIAETARTYQEEYPNENISNCLGDLVSDPGFDEWRDFRNVLAHRLLPGRIVYLTNVPNSPYADRADLRIAGREIELNTATTEDRRVWLVRHLADVLCAANEFTKARV